MPSHVATLGVDFVFIHYSSFLLIPQKIKTITIDGKVVTDYTVERNYCFGMGDNRDHSLDSRYWGFIPYNNVVGTPMIVYWSWDTNLSMSHFFDKLSSIRFNRIAKIIR